MKLRVFSSNSAGNSYTLYNENEALLIEAGVKFSEIKKFFGFDISRIKGCLISHEHGDHLGKAKEYIGSGVDVFLLKETSDALGIRNHRLNIISPNKEFSVGGFKILPFSVKHDVPCVGFLINHEECGTVLFITDSYYSEYKFRGLNNIIVEANYSREIIDQKLGEKMFLRDRIWKSHMSLETCCDLLKANDLTEVNNIVLIHLSDSNSDEKMFVDTVKKLTGKSVYAADRNMEIEFNKNPF